MLNDKENKKYKIIEKVVNGFMTRKEASIELNLSLKQIDRLKKFIILKVKKVLFIKAEEEKILIRKMLI